MSGASWKTKRDKMQLHIVLKPSDNFFVTISNTTTALPTPAENVVGAIMTIETADVRMRQDGVNPVSGVGGGYPMIQDSVWEIQGRDIITKMRFYREGATNGYVSGFYIAGY
jgi:hypothetical protein